MNLSLPFRNQTALDTFIANQASHGTYLTQAQFDAEYAPTAQQAQAARAWALAHGLQVAYVAPDNSLITVHGTTSAVDSALQVKINDYRSAQGQSFYSNDRDPTVPASLGVLAITGLNNLIRFHTVLQPGTRTGAPNGGYIPSDFRAAYNLAGHGSDGTGQSIGFTLWGASLPNSDLTGFAQQTGDVQMSSGTGPDQIEWKAVGGGSSCTDSLDEVALDVESAHGIATHAHLKYWLAPEDACGLGGTDAGMEAALTAAANDPDVRMVSNSWLDGSEAPSTSDPFVVATTQAFQHGIAVGKTFYFASGDAGSDSGGASLPTYPADSPYVVAVGGTNLTLSGAQYESESAWSGSGGGCSTVFTRPSWQSGAGAATCSGRAIPDVSADADPNTGAHVYFNGQSWVYGGTSLATPLIAGMIAVANRYAAQNGLSPLGWTAPVFYSLANSSSYSALYHDVTTGSDGAYSAGAGWDEATGWGSLNWWPWVQAAVGSTSGGGATNTPTATPTATRTGTNTPTATPSAIITAQSAAIAVTPGWNLISLPLQPTGALHASDLLGGLLQANPASTLVALYELTGNHWSPFRIQQAGHPTLGTDFPLQVGASYLLYSDKQNSYAEQGTMPSTPAAWTLSPGWNLVGLSAGTTGVVSASTVLKGVLQQSTSHLAALYELSNNRWSPSLIQPGSGTPTGQDFTLQVGQGYLLYMDTGTSYTPSAASAATRPRMAGKGIGNAP